MTPQIIAPGVQVVRRYADDLVLLNVRGHFSSVLLRPHDWLAQATHVRREGAGPGSLTDRGLEYHVLDGEWIEEHEPELFAAYLDMTPAISLALGKRVYPSEDRRSRININMLDGRGAEYELHTDSQPYTAILFASEHDAGGELYVQQPPRDPTVAKPPGERSYSGGAEWYIEPALGQMILFDGARYPHAVRPLQRDGLRVTIPMVYVDPEVGERRDEGLDQHLY